MRPENGCKLPVNLSRQIPSELTARGTRLYNRFPDELQCVRKIGVYDRNTAEFCCKTCHNAKRFTCNNPYYVDEHEMAIDQDITPRACNRCFTPVIIVGDVLRCTECVNELNSLPSPTDADIARSLNLDE